MKNVMFIVLCFLICSTIALGATINPYFVGSQPYWSYAAAGTNIGVVGTGSMGGSIAGFDDNYLGINYEWRTSVGFDVRAEVLGFNPGDVVSATLIFDTIDLVGGSRDMVTMDQTQSYLLGPDPGDFMYGYHWTTLVTNGTPGDSWSIDITDAFKAAMTAANWAQGISFVWYADNDADVDLGNGLVSPYNGSGDVVYNACFSVVNARIEVVPEPMTVALLSLGGLFLRRRK
jgi:hypothetical protein